MADYRMEWSRFADWCASVGRTAMPATEDTVLAYLTEEEPTGGTAARWAAAIRDRHRAAGSPDPCGGTVRALVRHARAGRGTDADAFIGRAAEPAGRLARAGWPNGVFGRRDVFAYLLHRVAGLSVPALLALRTDDVSVPGPGTLEVRLSAGPVLLRPPARRSSSCPACAALRWGWVLRHVAVFATRDLALKLADHVPLDDEHVCQRQSLTSQPWAPTGFPLFPAVDRWGAFPALPAPAMSVRSLESVLRHVEQGTAVRTQVRIPGGAPARRPAPEEPVLPRTAPAPTSEEMREMHAAGVAARRKGQTSLAEIDAEYDDLDSEMADIEARIAALLAEVTEE